MDGGHVTIPSSEVDKEEVKRLGTGYNGPEAFECMVGLKNKWQETQCLGFFAII